MASIAITEATPMMIPNMVRNALNLLRRNAERATFIKFIIFITTLFSELNCVFNREAV